MFVDFQIVINVYFFFNGTKFKPFFDEFETLLNSIWWDSNDCIFYIFRRAYATV